MSSIGSLCRQRKPIMMTPATTINTDIGLLIDMLGKPMIKMTNVKCILTPGIHSYILNDPKPHHQCNQVAAAVV